MTIEEASQGAREQWDSHSSVSVPLSTFDSKSFITMCSFPLLESSNPCLKFCCCQRTGRSAKLHRPQEKNPPGGSVLEFSDKITSYVMSDFKETAHLDENR